MENYIDISYYRRTTRIYGSGRGCQFEPKVALTKFGGVLNTCKNYTVNIEEGSLSRYGTLATGRPTSVAHTYKPLHTSKERWEI